jgi:hypothetical protein
MRDLETGSLWSQLLGRCMSGDRKGRALELLPGVLTTWGDWKTRHPGTTMLALSRTTERFDAEVWNKPQRFVYGLPMAQGKAARAVTMSRLIRARVVMVGGEDRAVVTMSPKSKRVQAFKALLDGKPRQFRPAGPGRMRDRQTGSEWDLVTGLCVDGPEKGKALTPCPGFLSYRRAWEVFHPDGTIEE